MILACLDLARHYACHPREFLDMDEDELHALWEYTQKAIDRRSQRPE